MGSGEAKEFICTTCRHELKGGMLVRGGMQGRGEKGEKKWDNCNSIINKIYLKMKKKGSCLEMQNLLNQTQESSCQAAIGMIDCKGPRNMNGGDPP